LLCFYSIKYHNSAALFAATGCCCPFLLSHSLVLVIGLHSMVILRSGFYVWGYRMGLIECFG
jgi:hypothetical protein